jgi:hypothetical protein
VSPLIFLTAMEENPWAFPLLYISAQSVENFSEFFKFAESSADNSHFMPQRVDEIVHNERFQVVKMTRCWPPPSRERAVSPATADQQHLLGLTAAGLGEALFFHSVQRIQFRAEPPPHHC